MDYTEGDYLRELRLARLTSGELDELERDLWTKGDPRHALVAHLADAMVFEEGEADRHDEDFEEGKLEGMQEKEADMREALSPVRDRLEELAQGRVRKADVLAVLQDLNNALA